MPDNLGYNFNSEKTIVDADLRHQWTRDDLEKNANGNSEKSTLTYNEAIEHCGIGRFHHILLFVCGGCLMGVITETLNIGFIIPVAQCDLNLSYRDKGLLNGAAFLGIVLSSHFWGFLSDVWGRRQVLRLSLSSAVVVSIISSFSISAWMLIVTRFFVGVFVSGNAATSYAYLGEFHSDKTRAKAISFAAMFMAFGMVYLPALAWMIVPFRAHLEFDLAFIGLRFTVWRIFIVLCTLMNVVTLVGIFKLPESGKFLLSKGEHNKAVEVLEEVHGWNRSKDPINFHHTNLVLDVNDLTAKRSQNSGFRLMVSQTVALFNKALLWNTIRASLIMFGLFSASSGFFLWVPDILNKLIQASDLDQTVCAVIGDSVKNSTSVTDKQVNAASTCSDHVDVYIYQVTLAMGVIFSLTYASIGFSITKFGKRNLLVFWFVLCGAAAVALIWTTNFTLNIVLIVVFLIVGNCGSIMSAISVDIFPTSVRAMALCLVLMIGRLGAMSGSNLIGYLLITNCNLIFVAFGGILIVCAMIALTFPSDKR